MDGAGRLIVVLYVVSIRPRLQPRVLSASLPPQVRLKDVEAKQTHITSQLWPIKAQILPQIPWLTPIFTSQKQLRVVLKERRQVLRVQIVQELEKQLKCLAEQW